MRKVTAFNGAGFFTLTMKEYRKQKRARSWNMTLAPLRRLLSRLVTPNSAVSIFAVIVPIGLTVQHFA